MFNTGVSHGGEWCGAVVAFWPPSSERGRTCVNRAAVPGSDPEGKLVRLTDRSLAAASGTARCAIS